MCKSRLLPSPQKMSGVQGGSSTFCDVSPGSVGSRLASIVGVWCILLSFNSTIQVVSHGKVPHKATVMAMIIQ